MPDKLLKFSSKVQLNAATATQIFAILARRGAGKSYLAGVIVEYLASIGCPVIVLDTVGNWWGLTLAANGKDPGLAQVTNYSAGTGGFNNSLSNLRTLGIIEGKPKMALAPELR